MPKAVNRSVDRRQKLLRTYYPLRPAEINCPNCGRELHVCRRVEKAEGRWVPVIVRGCLQPECGYEEAV